MTTRQCAAYVVTALSLTLSHRAVSAPEDAGSPRLEEVLVTAQKRTERLQDVPIAVMAFTESTLEKPGVDNVAKFQAMVPGLVYNNLAGHAQPFLRGVGSEFTQPNQDSSVATYVDGAYVGFVDSIIQSLIGVERVEVLAGPQGTLYGRNATAGAINIITLTPKQEAEGAAKVTIGNYAKKQVSGHISGGVTEDLALGLYGGGFRSNSYMDRIGPPDAKAPDHNSAWGARLKAVYTPASWVTLTAALGKSKSEDVETSKWRNLSPRGLGYTIYGTAFIDEEYLTTAYYDSFSLRGEDVGYLKAEFDLGGPSLVSISAHRRLKATQHTDVSNTGGPALLSASWTTVHQFSEELQLLSPADSWLRWIVGAYYYDEDAKVEPQSSISPIALGNRSRIDNYSTVNTKSYAGFAELTFPLDALVEGLSLTAGGRYTKDKKDLTTEQISTFIAGGTATNIPQYTIDDSWHKFTPKATLSYKHGSQLFYATYSEGYKSGVYSTSAPATPGPADPETLKAYEVGAKLQLWDRRLTWNSAAYYYDSKDMQVNIVLLGTGGTTRLQNAASATVKGLESSLSAYLTDNWQLNGSVSRIKGKYDRYPGYTGINMGTLASQIVDVGGNTMQRMPKWTAAAGVNYSRPLEAGGSIHGSVDWYWNDGYYFTPQNNFRQPSYNTANLSVGYTTPKNLTFTAWVTNLTDEYHLVAYLPVARQGLHVADAPPKMYGLTVAYDFE